MAQAHLDNLPGKLKFFGSLLDVERTNSWANMFLKNIRTMDESLCPALCKTLETNDHIFIARQFWDSLWITSRSETRSSHTSLIGAGMNLPTSVHLDMVLVILRHIWKSRNTLIFDSKDNTARQLKSFTTSIETSASRHAHSSATRG
jgi:hypothetical protein